MRRPASSRYGGNPRLSGVFRGSLVGNERVLMLAGVLLWSSSVTLGVSAFTLESGIDASRGLPLPSSGISKLASGR